eukprot:COSAG01_NODE_37918_length_497_cov_0.643216_1_plen_34_part_01
MVPHQDTSDDAGIVRWCAEDAAVLAWRIGLVDGS